MEFGSVGLLVVGEDDCLACVRKGCEMSWDYASARLEEDLSGWESPVTDCRCSMGEWDSLGVVIIVLEID